ncbi:tetratricopeptide repeat protein [Marinobacter fonticola]|uniref:hypothetical protein n=1 Tax=Marinobacter fonticola TaxID=2603215 RepID=UPI0011E817F8|nr:hypothetical protein [Marinobacter fonticola]
MMQSRVFPCLCLASLLLAGCATGPGGPVYVPAEKAPPPPQTDTSEPETPSAAEQQQRRQQQAEEPERSAPRYQDDSEDMSPAAQSLVNRADALLAQGEARAAIGQLERAQRISPRSGKIYFKLAAAYRSIDELGRAEQFALKGLSLSGSNTALQRTGWMLLADIRRADGNVAGAEKAEARAAEL